ncbi:Uu.00g083720.m01.CDS01 [Anthostomella pinea]|uniref:Queuine tRNA-ribosyltransferase accessory subunit 2 n=1 Tax=Anthostomella pinea TaxID=933095 RepID=A0AAI8YJI4_9PEZI|nr:Uu.00g083720.m01.CDS01 [Anthostomella pinea]
MQKGDGDRRVVFEVLRSITNDGAGIRVGRLALPKRPPMDTPNFIGLTSRGAVPHMTPDNLVKHTELGGTYIALEDFLETSRKRAFPAIYNMESEDIETLHAYTATPSYMATVLAARRHPAVTTPMGNGSNDISIYTSTGFQKLSNENYRHAINKLKPDIAIPLADLTFNRSKTPNSFKRQLRMVERTEDWLAGFFRLAGSDGGIQSAVFAPLLPIPYPTQWEYIDRLEQEHAGQLSGLAVYDADILPDLSNPGPLSPLPRLSLDFIASPHDILRQVQLGIDIFMLPFLNSTSDAGIALEFAFPPLADSTQSIRPLGVDMWSQDHKVSLMPLVEGCKCYTCTKHHRAYLHHLLNAKEMLGWTLLQIHNHQVVNDFFAGIRASISTEPAAFEKNCDLFSRIYDSELPKGTGLRPRARGYHFKSQGGDEKINPPAFQKFDEDGSEDLALAAEVAGLVVTGVAAEGNETPLVPEIDAKELDKPGFADVTN